MGGEWDFDVDISYDIDLKDYFSFLINMFEELFEIQILNWNLEQYNVIKKAIEKDNIEDVNIDTFDTPFLSIFHKHYYFKMYLNPNRTSCSLHARGVDNYEFKKIIDKIQKKTEIQFPNKFKQYIPDGIIGYSF